MFVAEFENLRRCLNAYCEIAACYSLALVFRSAVSTILAIVAVAGLGDNSDFIPRGDYLLYMGEILAIILLADFGTHMRMEVCKFNVILATDFGNFGCHNFIGMSTD